ncbi:MAG: S8 family serine peptidase [Oligoflexia bacterium]|nr:S8 family serine peptidase [Oligoflexia bacterium]
MELDGEIRHVSEREASEVCTSERFCEPNYLYNTQFARKRKEPAPVPAPTPAPTPTAVTPVIRDQLDYSRAKIRAPEAWRLTQGSEEIVVAVIDTGVDYRHPDLADNIWINEGERAGLAGVDDDGNGYVDDVYGYDFHNNRGNAMDDNKHGTHVAGIIGALLNDTGIVGVSPKVRIMALKFLGSSGSGDANNAIRAINYAVDHGARIISNSWGGGGRSQLLEAAIQRAISKGIYVVAAAGNESSNNDQVPMYPAGYSGVISVASSDAADALSSFSNYGASSVWIAAPGSDILSTIPGLRHARLSGTSMAAPQVSGALALALSMGKDPGLTAMRRALCDSAAKILLDQVRCGRLDAYELVRAASRF